MCNSRDLLVAYVLAKGGKWAGTWVELRFYFPADISELGLISKYFHCTDGNK